MICEAINAAAAFAKDAAAPLKTRLVGLETENARLRASLAEARSKA
jgi:hypothetical protein